MTQAEYLDRKTEALPPKRSMADLTTTLTESQRDGLLDLAQSLGGDGWDLELYIESYWQAPVTTERLREFCVAFTEWLQKELSNDE